MAASTQPIGVDHLTTVPENFDPESGDRVEDSDLESGDRVEDSDAGE